MSNLHELQQGGQSPWLNYMRREFIESNELRQCIEMGIEGITVNAAVFADTITCHDDYDLAIQQAIVAGIPYRRIHQSLMIDDVQRTADMLHPVFEASEGLNGFASLELDPALADNVNKTVATAKHLLAGIDRGNTMVEIPATRNGCAAIRRLTADGVSLNATHIFSVAVFERVAQAYIDGLEQFFETHSVWRITPTAVASFSIAPIDAMVDSILEEKALPTLQGQTGLALAHLLYARFRQIFSGPRWRQLQKRGARWLRPKWTRLQPIHLDYPDTFYIEALPVPDTVMTFTPELLTHFLDKERIRRPLTDSPYLSLQHMENLTAANIDVNWVADQLQQQHMAASAAQHETLIQRIVTKLPAIALTVG